jgi:hypothetical protein
MTLVSTTAFTIGPWNPVFHLAGGWSAGLRSPAGFDQFKDGAAFGHVTGEEVANLLLHGTAALAGESLEGPHDGISVLFQSKEASCWLTRIVLASVGGDTLL